jgi:hypothetical protein
LISSTATLTDIGLATLFSKLLGQANPEAVFPGQSGLDNLVFDFTVVIIKQLVWVNPQNKVAAHQNRF